MPFTVYDVLESADELLNAVRKQLERAYSLRPERGREIRRIWAAVVTLGSRLELLAQRGEEAPLREVGDLLKGVRTVQIQVASIDARVAH